MNDPSAASYEYGSLDVAWAANRFFEGPMHGAGSLREFVGADAEEFEQLCDPDAVSQEAALVRLVRGKTVEDLVQFLDCSRHHAERILGAAAYAATLLW